jgi:phosphate uptake regulator
VAAADEAFAEELGKLADDTTEMGLFAEDVFKNAAAALYVAEPEAAAGAIQDARLCAQQLMDINSRALTLLARYLASGDAIRRIVEVQRVAGEFAHIAEHSREIAEHALALHGTVDEDLLASGGDAPMLLLRMLRQTYVEVRASVVASTTRDTVMARRIITEDGELVRLYLLYKAHLERAIAADRYSAPRLTRLLLVGARLHQIGTAVVGIARTTLYTPPQMEG